MVQVTLRSLIEAVDNMLDKLSERKVKLITRLEDKKAPKVELYQSIDDIKRLEWALKPLRLQLLHSLEEIESAADEGEDVEPLLSRFLFLQSQFDRL